MNPDTETDPAPESDANTRRSRSGSRLSTRKKIVFALLPAAVLALLAYLAYAGYRSKRYYDDLKRSPQWDTRITKDDPELGYTVIPNSRGHLAIRGEYPVFCGHDDAGFRIDPSSAQDGDGRERRPLVLALGDSFTYGYGIEAKEGFPHLVARELGGTARNAGGNGYGLAHMLLLARRHIPALRPEYVLVQYSPWLTARGIYPYAPTGFVTIPVPYFIDDGDSVAITGPAFRADIDRSPVWNYTTTEASTVDFLSFFVRVGLPTRIHNDARLALYRSRRACGITPDPTDRFRLVERYVHDEIARICRENGSTIVIVAIPNWEGITHMIRDVLPPGVPAISADRVMWDRLPEKTTNEFLRHYGIHWGEKLNAHHNAEANRIIALSILEGLRQFTETPAPPAGTE